MTDFAPLLASEAGTMAQVVSDSFNMDSDKCELWVRRSGLENWRALKSRDTVLGGLLRIPMAQWFGGQAVGMTGLAGVAVSTLGRGKGAGQTMMRETLKEMMAEGTALSALYGSTTTFYRRCGYERAGSRFMAEIPLRELDARGGPLDVRALTVDDHEEVEALQQAHVQQHATLKRGPYLWHRVRAPRGKTAQGYGFYREGTLEGYTYLVKDLVDFRDNALEATDLVLKTPDALATFLGLLASHRAFFTAARWPTPPSSALLLSMPEPWQYSLKLDEHWMMRIVSLEAALDQRGYPVHIDGELHLNVEDAWFPENAGAWLLKVHGGRATAARGGASDLRLDIGALAALYSGFITAEELALAGRAQGSPTALSLASAVFGGWTPQLADFF